MEKIKNMITKDYRNINFCTFGVRSRTNAIVIHGTMTYNMEQVKNAWFPIGTRQASANFVVEDEKVGYFVDMNFSSWHGGGVSPHSNHETIGVEHCNNYINGKNSTFSEKTIHTGAKLVAQLCEVYGLIPSHRTIIPHRDVNATNCPQALDMVKYIELVKHYYYLSSHEESRTELKKKEENHMKKFTITSNHQGLIKGATFVIDFDRRVFFGISKETSDVLSTKMGLKEVVELNPRELDVMVDVYQLKKLGGK